MNELRERSARLRGAAKKYRDALSAIGESQREFAVSLSAFGTAEGDLVRRACEYPRATRRYPNAPSLLQASTGAISSLAETLKKLAVLNDTLRHEARARVPQE